MQHAHEQKKAKCSGQRAAEKGSSGVSLDYDKSTCAHAKEDHAERSN